MDRLRLKGELRGAQKSCEALLEKHPDYVAALHSLGLIHIAKQTYWQALSCFVRAAMLNPEDWTILTNLSQVYLALGADEMAASTLIPSLTDQNRCAQSRNPMDMIRHG